MALDGRFERAHGGELHSFDRLLLQFSHHIGKILTSEDLLTSVWGTEYKNDKEILWVSIARLRQKLEMDAHSPRHIVTRSGLGYLMPPIE